MDGMRVNAVIWYLNTSQSLVEDRNTRCVLGDCLNGNVDIPTRHKDNAGTTYEGPGSSEVDVLIFS